MYRICIISAYFGRFPNYFKLWLNSCERNSTLDFLLVTDQHIDDLPSNVILKAISFEELKVLIDNKIGITKGLVSPYKLCDFKPLYGAIFEDFLIGYDFWGHCDMDLIWGDIRKFVTDDILQEYDKIFPMGHLSLYRNNKDNNMAFMLPGSKRGNWREVMSLPISCVFDETYGIDKIYETNSLPIYMKHVAADIGFRNQRMIVEGGEIENYSSQLFLLKDGKVLRAYYDNGKVAFDEFCYIHMQKRQYEDPPNDLSSNFIIGQNRFILYNGETITKELIDSVNPPRSSVYERLEYFLKDYVFRITRRIKNYKILYYAQNK